MFGRIKHVFSKARPDVLNAHFKSLYKYCVAVGEAFENGYVQ